MPAETADGKGEDGWEDAGFEKEDEGKHRDAAFAVDAHCSGDEDDDAGEEEHENPAGFSEHHEPGGGEAADCEESLADGVAV